MNRSIVNLQSSLVAVAVLATAAVAVTATQPPHELPAAGVAKLAASLNAAARHARHVWRDTPATNADGTVNAYIEIARGDRRKWELDMRANARAIDRVIPEVVGGYPVNYGFVPQTISYDGDPFDALVLGPPLAGGELVRGVIVGLMHMRDEKGLDSKVVLSRVDQKRQPTHALTATDRQQIADYFNRYKAHQPGAFSEVPGWAAADEGRLFVHVTHAFFLQCRHDANLPCRVSP